MPPRPVAFERDQKSLNSLNRQATGAAAEGPAAYHRFNSPPSKMAERYRAQVFSLASLERAVAGTRSYTQRNRTAFSNSDAQQIAISLGSGRSSVELSHENARRAWMKTDLGTQSRFPPKSPARITECYCGYWG